MPHKELTGKRSLVYSAWHRADSIKRYLGGDRVKAMRLTMIDIDGAYVEAKHPFDRPPSVLIETAEVSVPIDKESDFFKNAAILTALGKAAKIPVFVVLYRPSSRRNPADPNWQDIEEFYIKQSYPIRDIKWTVLAPKEFAEFLVYIRYESKRIKKAGYQLALDILAGHQQLDDKDLELYYRYAFERTNHE